MYVGKRFANRTNNKLQHCTWNALAASEAQTNSYVIVSYIVLKSVKYDMQPTNPCKTQCRVTKFKLIAFFMQDQKFNFDCIASVKNTQIAFAFFHTTLSRL